MQLHSPFLLLANTHKEGEAAGDGSSICIPATHTGDFEFQASGFRLAKSWLSESNCGVNQWRGDILSASKINLKIRKNYSKAAKLKYVLFREIHK